MFVLVKNEKVKVNLAYAYRLLYPRNVVLVTCVDKVGKANIIPIAWVMPTSFNPPKIAISVGLGRYSHKLIEETKEFVVNIPTANLLEKIRFCGSVSGKSLDKFKESGLTSQPAKKVKPPIIVECVAHLECKVSHQTTTGDHTIFVGDIVEAYANKKIFDKILNLEKLKLVLHVGEDVFWTT